MFTTFPAMADLKQFSAEMQRDESVFPHRDFDVDRYEKVERTEGDISIVGGGLGRLALVLALQERGIKAQLFERHPGLRSDTATVISIGPNGVAALEGIRPGLSKDIALHGAYTTLLKANIVRAGNKVSTMTHSYPEGVFASVCWKLVQQTLAKFVDKDTICFSHKLLFYKQSVLPMHNMLDLGKGLELHLRMLINFQFYLRSLANILFQRKVSKLQSRGLKRSESLVCKKCKSMQLIGPKFLPSSQSGCKS